ncbi:MULTISPECIES: hypothetical protein [unclassified Nocardioides]|uniref:hypothetical protein n=1 Tax=unclassified Nocardioides TaxID=2615069 RepID=UPI003014D645
MNQKQHDDLDAPTPPGGPQRTDAPDGRDTPGEAATAPAPSTPAAGTDVPEPSGDRPEQDAAERDAQEENAETSLDQPSQ